MATISMAEQVARQAFRAKAASRAVADLSSEGKKRALEGTADALSSAESHILFHNEIDVEAARDTDLSAALVDRLTLTSKSVRAMADGVREIARQPDPVGEVLETWTRPNDLRLEKIRVPLGVIG